MLAHADRLPAQRGGHQRRVSGRGQADDGDGLQQRRPVSRRRRSQAAASSAAAHLLRGQLEYRERVAGRALLAGGRPSSTAGAAVAHPAAGAATAVAHPAAGAAAEPHAGDAVPDGQLVDGGRGAVVVRRRLPTAAGHAGRLVMVAGLDGRTLRTYSRVHVFAARVFVCVGRQLVLLITCVFFGYPLSFVHVLIHRPQNPIFSSQFVAGLASFTHVVIMQ